MDTELREQLKASFRQGVFEVLGLISSKRAQLDNQQKVSIADVSAELFNQWEDCYQSPKEQDWYSEAFSEAELMVLREFDEEFEAVIKNTLQNPPKINEFIKTLEWERLSSAAAIAHGKLLKI